MESEKKVLVIGGANYDITGRITGDVIPADSNPGSVTGGCGGVGRNVAENLARLGVSTSLFTAFGTDDFSGVIRNSLTSAGIDFSHSVTIPGSSSVYLSVVDRHGELVLAACDLKLLETLPASALEKEKDYFGSFPYVFLEANSTVQMLEYAASVINGRIFADGVSVAKAVRLIPVLSRIDTIKVNMRELSAVTEYPVDSLENARKAAEILLKRGVKHVFVTLGKDGCFCVSDRGFFSFPAFPLEVANVTGAGDAFAAAVVFGTMRDLAEEKILALGTAASHIALESRFAVSPLLTEQSLLRKAEEFTAG